MTTLRTPALVLATLMAATVLAGCGAGDAASTRTLTVYAAASLSGTFTELGQEFEADHPGVKVALNFGGSSDLASQLTQGAPADVFASADSPVMDRLVAEGLTDQTPEDFASNTLEIVTPPDNPAHISSFADLIRSGVDLVVCAPEVPCGRATRAVAAAAGVTLAPVSEEQSVKDVLAKVTSGEAEAGLVYVTDVKAAGGKVHGIAFPESAAAVNRYPITTLGDSRHGALAQAFVRLVLGRAGQAVLADAGFGRP